MSDPCGPALRQLRGGAWPVLDAHGEQRRREHIATRVIELQRQLDRRRERGRFALVLSLAALVAGLGAAVPLLHLFPDVPEFGETERAELPAGNSVQLLAGHASVRDALGTGLLDPLEPGQFQLASDALLVTPRDDGAELRLWSQASLSVAPASEVGLVRRRPNLEAFEERVRLKTGSVALRVPKLGARGKVSVQTSDALVEVHGTQFSVHVVERPPLEPFTEVDVREGRVLVRSGAQSRLLGAGDHWSSARPSATTPAPSPPQARRHRRQRPAPIVTSTLSELAAQNQLLEDAEHARSNGLPLLAARHLDTLIARYPEAELAHNARVQRFRLLRQTGRDSDAIAGAEDYLRRHPQGFARDEARQLISTLSAVTP
jgi:hypothetical protein